MIKQQTSFVKSRGNYSVLHKTVTRLMFLRNHYVKFEMDNY